MPPRAYPLLSLPSSHPLFKPPICNSSFQTSISASSFSSRTKRKQNEEAKKGCRTTRLPTPCRASSRRGCTPTALRVWAISSWRTPEALAHWFICAGYTHLPLRSPMMFRLEQLRRHANAPPSELVVYFTNRFDADLLLGQVWWFGCEFIADRKSVV